MTSDRSTRSTLRHILADMLRWSRDKHVPVSHILGAALGMAVPIAVGVAAGHLEVGVLASLGGMAMSGATGTGSWHERCRPASHVLMASIIAMAVGTLISGSEGLVVPVTVAVVFLAALIGGMSRTMARCSGMFVVFAIIGAGFASTHPVDPAGAVLVFALGALWTMTMTLLSSALLGAVGAEEVPLPAPSLSVNAVRRTPTLKQRARRWARSLRTMEGWQFTLRLSICVVAAEMVVALWPHQTSYWIPLVVVLIVRRDRGTTVNRATQRAVGTLLGVLIGGVLLLRPCPEEVLVAIVGALAALRTLLKARNYVLYSMVMTPLVVIVLEFGTNPSAAIMMYRLIDTVVGASIAVMLGHLVWPSRPGPEASSLQAGRT